MKLAVFVDAENFSPRLFPVAMTEIDTIGTVIHRRAFGNFLLPSMQPWKAVLERWPMTTVQVTPLAQKRNATDMHLAIDAMDVLHQGSVEGFCILSSDSDFSALALRLREQGAAVFGFGEAKALPAYASVFDRYFACNTVSSGRDGVAKRGTDAAIIVNAALSGLESQDWVPLSLLGEQLREVRTDFTPKAYGFSKLADLVRSVPGIEVKALTKGAGTTLSVRRHSTAWPEVLPRTLAGDAADPT